MRRTALSGLAALAILSLGVPTRASTVLAPGDFLGYALGERFTPPHRIVDYAEHLAAASDRVALEEIGRTPENRPLVLLTITTPARRVELDDVRRRHLALEPPTQPEPAIVWLGFGIHGNEASSSEAALALAWELATGPEEDLESLVVLIDPLSNPDGRARYVSSFAAHRGSRPDPSPLAAERLEPWPGGRTNHYLVDLNRDWAWSTQAETRARLAALRRWEPHVLADFHEMTSESEYYFPPAAQPAHPGISDEILRWQSVFGRAHAATFDARGWQYFIRERFDLFYPGYGDSYPSLRGSLGMTYEVSGGSRAGLVPENGERLSLSERVQRHLATARSTLATSAHHHAALDATWRDLRETKRSGQLLWDHEAPESNALARLLRDHGVEVRALTEPAQRTTHLLGGTSFRARTVPAGTLVVDLDQPLGPLALGILDPTIEVPDTIRDEQQSRVASHQDPELSDVTAWSIPLAWNLPIERTETPFPSSTPWKPPEGGLEGTGDLGALLLPGGTDTWSAVSRLLRQKHPLYRLRQPLELGERTWPRGSFWIPFDNTSGSSTSATAPNPSEAPANPSDALARLLREHGLVAWRVASGFSEAGPGLGSPTLARVRDREIGLVGGTGVSPTSFGALWHLLDVTLDVGPHRLGPAVFDQKIEPLDVLILPDGSGWSSILSSERLATLEAWIRSGGTLICVGGSLTPWQAAEATTFETWEAPEGTPTAPIPGAAVATRRSEASPLDTGPGPPPAALIRGTSFLRATGDPTRDALVVDSISEGRPRVLAGVVWADLEPGLDAALVVGVEPIGQGHLVVFAGDPFFRGYWRSTLPTLLDAIFVLPDTP